jgi:hypothetical protein
VGPVELHFGTQQERSDDQKSQPGQQQPGQRFPKFFAD